MVNTSFAGRRVLPAGESVDEAYELIETTRRFAIQHIGAASVRNMAVAGAAETARESGRALATLIADKHEPNYAKPNVNPAKAFNLRGIFDALHVAPNPGDFQYMVVFTSLLREEFGSKYDNSTIKRFPLFDRLLTVADEFAHDDAIRLPSGGLNFYYRALDRSFCLWDTELQAKLGSRSAGHVAPASLAPMMYKEHSVQGYYAFRNEEGDIDLLTRGQLSDTQRVKVDTASFEAETMIRRTYEELEARVA